jgi:hypothetical protein
MADWMVELFISIYATKVRANARDMGLRILATHKAATNQVKLGKTIEIPRFVQHTYKFKFVMHYFVLVTMDVMASWF